MDEHVEKMVKQFTMTNSSPSTCVQMLHRMDDRRYDVSLLEEKGVDTLSTKAQQLVDCLMTNPDTNAVIVIHDPSSALIGGRQKGRPNKKRENHLVLLMKMSNKEASVEELVFDRDYTVDDYAQARRHALYLPVLQRATKRQSMVGHGFVSRSRIGERCQDIWVTTLS
jgi:hypothetical protein